MTKLHIGCGETIFDSWVNIDIENHPGVDRVLDVRLGLPFTNVSFIFAEHFIEHLTFVEAVKFIKECYRVLKPGGILRLSTPNLDWVYATHYSLDEKSEDESYVQCLRLNEAFFGHNHKFLYNTSVLRRIFRSAGFQKYQLFPYGKSDIQELNNLEHHPTYPDYGGIKHVIIIQGYK